LRTDVLPVFAPGPSAGGGRSFSDPIVIAKEKAYFSRVDAESLRPLAFLSERPPEELPETLEPSGTSSGK
jgi:hypothetical protein